MRRFATCIVASVALVTLWVAPASSNGSKRTIVLEPRVGTQRFIDLQPGDIVYMNNVGVEVQPPGGVVEGYFDGEGVAQELDAETLLNGTVVVTFWTDVQQFDAGSERSPAEVLAECTDSYYRTPLAPKWASTHHWSFNKNSTPPSVNKDNAETALKNAHANITHEDNNCGRPDTVSATHAYDGTTTIYANIVVRDGRDVCLSPDGTSVTDFDNQSSGCLACICNWGNPRTESDTTQNTDHQWVVNAGPTCTNKYYVEGVGTHEYGHTYGLKDTGSGHPDLTMGGANGSCPGPDEKKTLGLGDMLGLEALY